MLLKILGLIVEKRKYKTELHFPFRHGWLQRNPNSHPLQCLSLIFVWLALTREHGLPGQTCELVAQGLEAPTQGLGGLTLPALLPSAHVQLHLRKPREAGLPVPVQPPVSCAP